LRWHFLPGPKVTLPLARKPISQQTTLSAEKPAVQPELDLTYKEIFYAGIWGTNVDFGSDPNGQELASIEIDYWVGVAPTLGKWTVDVAAYYYTYPGRM
jgi:uncharacterized protein (TIGR02001 family)